MNAHILEEQSAKLAQAQQQITALIDTVRDAVAVAIQDAPADSVDWLEETDNRVTDQLSLVKTMTRAVQMELLRQIH